MPDPIALLFLDARGARHALNALCGAVEASPLAGRVEVGWERDPAALGRACARAAAEGRPALACWSFPSAGFAAAAAGLRAARAGGGAGAWHLAGGVHATAEPEEVLSAGFDLAAVGEGERTLVLLLERLLAGGPAAGPGLAWREQGRTVRGSRPAPVDLDATPPFPPSLGRGGPIELTRGCVHACRFCQTSFAAGIRPRHRSPAVVARWAAALVRSGRPDVRFVTPSALAYGSEDGSARLDRVEALLVAVREAVGPGARVFLGTFPSEVRPEHVGPEVASPDCQVKVRPGDRVQERGDLTIGGGERVKSAVALHGAVAIRKGAVVEDAVALGGTVTVEAGARVEKNAVAVGGDVRVRAGASVGNDAVSIGGKVRVEERGAVQGHSLSLALDWGSGGLAGKILEQVAGCRVAAE